MSNTKGPVIQARVTYCPDLEPRWCAEVGPCHDAGDADLAGYGDDPLSAALQALEATYAALLSERGEPWQRIIRDDADPHGCRTDDHEQAVGRAEIEALLPAALAQKRATTA